MGHLVIAFSRYETDVTKYMPYVEQMYEEFPEYTGFTLQIELALLAARRWLPKEHINEFTIMMHRLDQFGIQSPDRQNNYLVIKNTFEQSQLKKKKFQLKSMLSVRQEFRKILESYPDHRQAMLNYLELSRELAKKWESDVEIDFAVSSILDRFPDCDGVLQALVDLIAEERAHVPCTNEERLELIRLYLAAGGIETRVQTIQARLPKELQERISRMPRLPASKQKQNFDIRPGVVNPFHPYERSRTRN